MVSAAQMIEEILRIEDCPQLDNLSKKILESYLGRFGSNQ